MQHTYFAKVSWQCDSSIFLEGRYSREHVWSFDGGIEVPASSSPSIVPLPFSTESAVDPEEAFVASLSSCHMLWFLSIAAKRGFSVASYTDEAIGTMGLNVDGKLAMLSVTLRPRVIFSGDIQPKAEAIETMHHMAHEECFIASSVKSDVICIPIF